MNEVRVLALDPGTSETAYCGWDGARVLRMGHEPNENIRTMLMLTAEDGYDTVAIEMIASYGMAVGKETFQTCVWIGRFAERCPIEPRMVYRKDVKMHLCHSMKAKDGNISQAIRDRFGEKGTKANPGPLYGVSKHIWAALAVAIYAYDTAPGVIHS